MRLFVVLTAILASAAAGFLAGRHLPRRQTADAAPALATFQGGAVTTSDVESYVAAVGPAAEERLKTAEGVRALVDELATRALFAEAAREAGLHEDRPVAARLEEVLADEYRRREIETHARPASISEADVRAEFERERPLVATPERLRVGVIFVQGTGSERASKKEKAERLLVEARAALRRSPDAFATLARNQSDDPQTAPFGGQLPFTTRDELAAKLGDDVAEAAHAIGEAGALAPKVIEAESGFYVLRLLAREPAREPSFAQLEPRLRARLASRREAELMRTRVEALRAQKRLKIDDTALARVVATYSKR